MNKIYHSQEEKARRFLWKKKNDNTKNAAKSWKILFIVISNPDIII